ncbi:hypothetical protein BYI23_B012390 [Burkholderia sp. YI23]|nr:hypothetical protein BYI23_B012390 [Burkholderia sp. YI23]
MRSVHVALAWLLDSNEEHSFEHVCQAAQTARLIRLDDGPNWSAEGDAVLRLASASLGRLPLEAERLGQLLHGLGEIRARCHAVGLAKLFESAIGALKSRVSLAQAFESAVVCDHAIARQTCFDEVALAQWISRAAYSRETFEAAITRIRYPERVLGGYGLSFVTKLILVVAPSLIDEWISSNANDPACAVIGATALRCVLPFDEEPATSLLFLSKNTAIRCLGAAAIVHPPGFEKALSLRDCHRALVDAGFSPADAIWMTGVRIREAVFRRNRGEGGSHQHIARLKLLERFPEEASGGSRYAQQEIEQLRDQINRNAISHAELLVELDNLLVDTAADWPATGLGEEQMEALDSVFVNAADVRHRLACKLSHSENGNRLLKRNVDLLRKFIGLECGSAEISRQYFSPNESAFQKISDGAAQSAVELYQFTNRGVGKSTSDLVAGVAVASTKLIEMPFASVRQPEMWQSVVTRAASAMRFVFTVVACVPEEQRTSVAMLNQLALEHTLKLLCVRNLPHSSEEVIFRLANEAVFFLGWTVETDKQREQWVLTENLLTFPRALALWSSGGLIAKYPELGRLLFERVCVTPLAKGEHSLQLSRMLSLLDVAVASCVRSGNLDMLNRVMEIWEIGYTDWVPIDARFETMARRLALAVQADGPERDEVIADEILAHTQCRRLIDHQSSDSRTCPS